MDKRFTPSVRIVLAVATNLLVMFLFLGTVLLLGLVDKIKTDYATLAWMNMLVGLILSGSTFLVYRLCDKGNPIGLGFRIRKIDLWFAASTMVISLVVAFGFTAIMSQDAKVGAVFHLEKLSDSSFLFLLVLGLAGWMIAVMQEEVLNRGYVLANLQHLGFFAMFSISSLIFTLIHIPTHGFHPVELLVHFVGGIGYAYVYYKSGSLWMSTTMHALHNFSLDILFNNTYTVTLVSFAHPLTDVDKLAQQSIMVIVMLVLTHLFYGKNGVLTPASNLKELWKSDHRLRM